MKNKQLEGLGNLFLDIAKAFFIGGLGTTVFTPFGFVTALLSGIFATVCVFTGLYFLGRMDE